MLLYFQSSTALCVRQSYESFYSHILAFVDIDSHECRAYEAKGTGPCIQNLFRLRVCWSYSVLVTYLSTICPLRRGKHVRARFVSFHFEFDAALFVRETRTVISWFINMPVPHAYNRLLGLRNVTYILCMCLWSLCQYTPPKRIPPIAIVANRQNACHGKNNWI